MEQALQKCSAKKSEDGKKKQKEMNTQIKSDQLIKLKTKITHTSSQKKISQTHNHKISNIPYENELFLLIRKIP